MYDLKKVVKFIEKKNNIILMPFQVEMVECILKGETFACPRAVGRSMLYQGVADFIKYQDKVYIDRNKVDKIIDIDRVCDEYTTYEDFYNKSENKHMFTDLMNCNADFNNFK